MTVNRDDFSFFSSQLYVCCQQVLTFLCKCFFSISVFNIFVFKLKTFNCNKISNLELAGQLYLLQVLVDATWPACDCDNSAQNYFCTRYRGNCFWSIYCGNCFWTTYCGNWFEQFIVENAFEQFIVEIAHIQYRQISWTKNNKRCFSIASSS